MTAKGSLIGSLRGQRSRASVTLVVIAGLATASLTACRANGHGVAGPTRSVTPAPSAKTTTRSPSPVHKPGHETHTPSPSSSSTPGGAAPGGAQPGGNGRCPAYPTPNCTGVPAGTKLKELAPTESGGGYKLTKPGAVYNGVHFRGDILIAAEHVTIKNSLVDDAVRNELGNHYYSFTIIDSTVGPTSVCHSNDGIGRAHYTAQSVLLRGHSSGFMDSGDDITIRDSYVRNCSNGNDHAGGIQAYMPGTGLVVDHTTFDQRKVADYTAPIYLHDSAGQTIRNVTVTNTLFMGGTYSFQLKNAAGTLIVQNNRVVDKTWSYAPVEAQCPDIKWSGNTVVTIDADYRVTSTVRPLPCAS